MRWSSGASRGKLGPTTLNITNTNHPGCEVVRRTGLGAAAASSREAFIGIDATDLRQVVTLIAAGGSPGPAQGMTRETLVSVEWNERAPAAPEQPLTGRMIKGNRLIRNMRDPLPNV